MYVLMKYYPVNNSIFSSLYKIRTRSNVSHGDLKVSIIVNIQNRSNKSWITLFDMRTYCSLVFDFVSRSCSRFSITRTIIDNDDR